LKVFKPLGRNTLEISGAMPLGDKGFTGYIAFTHPAEMFMELLKQRLQSKNILLTGKTRVDSSHVTPIVETTEIAELRSPPLGLIAAQTMKPSQNMFTETVLWTLGDKIKRTSAAFAKDDNAELGRIVVRNFLDEIGVPRDAVLQYDGSGMSRHNQVTPSAVVTLYTYMAKESRNAQVWRDSLTVGGVDGTLSRRYPRQDGNARPGIGAVRLCDNGRRRAIGCIDHGQRRSRAANANIAHRRYRRSFGEL